MQAQARVRTYLKRSGCQSAIIILEILHFSSPNASLQSSYQSDLSMPE
jgi:hypothetical protein